MRVLLRTSTLLVAALLLSSCLASAYYTVAEVTAGGLLKDPSIKVHQSTNGNLVTFTIALRREKPVNWWLASLELIDPDGKARSRIEFRGEDIRRSLSVEVARSWGWVEFRRSGADVFQFSVDPKLLTTSKLYWELGPRSDEHGNPYAGGFLRWCYLQALSDTANPEAATPDPRQPLPRIPPPELGLSPGSPG